MNPRNKWLYEAITNASRQQQKETNPCVQMKIGTKTSIYSLLIIAITIMNHDIFFLLKNVSF